MRLRLRGWDTRQPSDAPAVSGATDGRGACTTSVRHRRSTDPSCRHLEPSPIGAAACVRQERASRNRAAHARSGRGPGSKGRTWSPPRGARIGRRSGGRGERPGVLERSPCSGTGCHSGSGGCRHHRCAPGVDGGDGRRRTTPTGQHRALLRRSWDLLPIAQRNTEPTGPTSARASPPTAAHSRSCSRFAPAMRKPTARQPGTRPSSDAGVSGARPETWLHSAHRGLPR